MSAQTPTFAAFASANRLRIKSDACGDSFAPGKLGHLYQHDADRFGIVLEAGAYGASLNATLRVRKRRAIAAGFGPHQEGDCEAILLFDPTDMIQAQLATHLIDAKKIRKAARPTDAQLRSRALFSSRARSRRPCFDQNTSAESGTRG